mmetsp:Transcript_46907/g.92328  ORF Transcript_46907/g.92328 Transcript_46907/m.92328 type:complete len:302 (+) Transcript_46907:32-937(+)
MRPGILSVEFGDAEENDTVADQPRPKSAMKQTGSQSGLRKRRVSFSSSNPTREFHKSQMVRTPTSANLKELSRRSSQSILKRRLSMEDMAINEDKLMKAEKLAEAQKKALLRLAEGGVTIGKMASSGLLQARFFWFSATTDGHKVCWRKEAPTSNTFKHKMIKIFTFNLKKTFKSRNLATTHALVYGWPGIKRVSEPWLCLTLLFDTHMKQPVRIKVKNEAQVDKWFNGLQAMVPRCQYFLTRPRMLWARMRWKLREEAKQLKLKYNTVSFMRTLYSTICSRKFVSVVFSPQGGKKKKKAL